MNRFVQPDRRDARARQLGGGICAALRYCAPLAMLTLMAPVAAFSQARPQTQSPAQVQTAQANNRKVVAILTTVHDHHGQVLSNLTKDDFELDEDGMRQTICVFEPAANIPLTLGVLVDTASSQKRILDKERAASSAFAGEMLSGATAVRAFLIHFDREVELLHGPTASSAKFARALDLLKAPEAETASKTDPVDTREGADLYDAIFLASDEMMKKERGRKAMIVFSDGVDRGSKETLENAIWAAQRSDVVIYTVLSDDEDEYENAPNLGWGMSLPRRGGRRGGYGTGPRELGEDILERISRETGGRMLKGFDEHALEQVYARISDDLRNEYVIGYSPSREYIGASYHKIHLTLTKKDLFIQARDGYYADQ